MNDPIRIVIVDDHPLFREGVAATLAAEAGMEVVGEGASADDAIHLAGTLLPDVLLLDITMPGGGLRAAQAVAETYPVTKIVMLTFSEAEEDVLKALKEGAKGYILKGVTASELKNSIRAVCAGEVTMTPSLAAGLLHDLTTNARQNTAYPPDELNLIDDLTPRERQILEHLASGKSNKEIAKALELSEKTIKHYMSNVLQKLQVRNRVEAALFAQKHTSAR
jgi:two-component system nitrate/nitrite response regulator NarL